MSGRGGGKSWAGAYDLIRRAKRGRTYLVGSPTGVLMGDTTFPTFKKIAEDLRVWRGAKKTPYPTVEISPGATIRFRTAEDPEKMRGPNLSGIWLDEASLMDDDAYKICIASLREAGEQGWLSATFTPKGQSHWTYERFGEARPHTELFHCRTRDNPFNPPGFADVLATQYVGQFALQELGGLFVSMEGAEWPPELFDGILFDDWPADLGSMVRVMALDPSKGKEDRTGDYSVWIMLAVDASVFPAVLWIDADLDNGRPVEPLASSPQSPSIIGDGFARMLEFAPAGVLIETNGFQEMVASAFYGYCAKRAALRCPIYTICNTEPKAQRIRQLTPYLAQRRIRIRNTRGGRLLLQQMRDFRGDPRQNQKLKLHDDGPDALKNAEVMADWLIHGAGAGMTQQVKALNT